MSFLLVAAFILSSLFFWYKDDWIPSFQLSTTSAEPETAARLETKPSPSNQSSDHAFHIIIPASESSVNICKTILSLTVLRYPAPVLLNLERKQTNVHRRSKDNLRAVRDWLHSSTRGPELDDIVLLLDSDNVWFQLPPSVLLGRFQSLTEEFNENLRARYGTTRDANGISRTSRYSQKVLFGADKECWQRSHTEQDLACAAVPDPNLPDHSWDVDADKDPNGHHNHPKYLNPEIVIGRAGDMRELYSYAISKADDALGKQYILGEIFGEQEYQRETWRSEHVNPWLNWLGDKLGSWKAPNISSLRMHVELGRNYEFGIGLDYSSSLFFTAAHAAKDADWIEFNDTSTLTSLQGYHNIPNPKPVVMPLDLERAKSPFYANQVEGSPGKASAEVDNLPNADSLDWSNLPLAINVLSREVSPILHVGNEEAQIKWWSRMWYHPWAKALLSKGIAEPPTLLFRDRTAFLRGAEPETFTSPAGTSAGGAWTEHGEWMNWDDLCGAYEEELFA